MIKKVLALALTLTLIASMSVASFAAVDTQTATGEGDVTNPVLDVTVPANLDFMIDAFNLMDPTGATGQFYSPEYFIIQNAAYNMKAVVTMDAVTAEGVTLTDDSDDINLTDVNETDKVALVGGVAATAIADGSDGTIAYGFDPGTETLVGSYDYNVASGGTTRLVDPDEGTGAIGFLLSAATESVPSTTPGVTNPDTLAENDGGVSSFRLYGEVNAYADWEKNDIDIDFTFDFIPVVLTYYTELASTGVETIGLNLLTVIETVAAPVDGDLPDGVDVVIAAGKAGSVTKYRDTDTEIVAYLKGEPTLVLGIMNPITQNTFPTTAYNYDTNTGMLTSILPAANSGSLAIVTNKGTYTLNFTIEATAPTAP